MLDLPALVVPCKTIAVGSIAPNIFVIIDHPRADHGGAGDGAAGGIARYLSRTQPRSAGRGRSQALILLDSSQMPDNSMVAGVIQRPRLEGITAGVANQNIGTADVAQK
jgi:hypothetical protein